MKNTLSQISFLILLLAGLGQSFRANAAAPAWNVDPASFQYNMTIMAVANLNCAELQNPGNKIGVFMGTECRGTAFTNQVINGHYLASLFVYSNQVGGETLSFKVYDTVKDSVYDCTATVIFQQNASYGTAMSPFIVYNNQAPITLELSDNRVRENAPLNTTIGNLSATDKDPNESFTYEMASGEGDKDNAKFSIKNNTLILSAAVNFDEQSSCKVRIAVKDSKGCAYEKAFVLQVINKDILPVSNFISPNADGVNDYFLIEDVDAYQEYSLSIYNDNGMEVFNISEKYRNNWDGIFEGKKLPDGAYSYVFKNNNGSVYTGIIHLVNPN